MLLLFILDISVLINVFENGSCKELIYFPMNASYVSCCCVQSLELSGPPFSIEVEAVVDREMATLAATKSQKGGRRPQKYGLFWMIRPTLKSLYNLWKV